ncbi:glycoside-pentoside-hexuronide (GPH):cation symporter [Corynebacterium sp. A21]|uniref:glycoside-pentoside-hexuronide (GPH):cation symporter n=1 Tax=Corynebacterium sp. A21 TaxID=3457318 RepID=UPI003FD66231
MSTAQAPADLQGGSGKGNHPITLKGEIPFFRVAGYAFGDAGCNIAFQMTGLFLLVFYTDVVGIRPEHSAMIFLFVKIWDAFADIFAGRVVDSTMTRWGKFRPFLLWYSIPLLASNLLCFWVPVDDYWAKVGWATISYALMGLLYSLVNIPYGSLAGAMSQNAVDRSRMAAARMVGGGLTILILSFILAPLIRTAEDLQQTFLLTAGIFMVIGVFFFLITFFTSKEVVEREVAKVSLRETLLTLRTNVPLLRLCASSLFYLTGLNVITSMGIYIAGDMLGRFTTGGWLSTVVIIITSGAVLYMGPLGPMITRRMGKRRGFVVFSFIGAAGLILFWLAVAFLDSFPVALVGLFIAGAGIAVLNTMTWAMEADTVEYGELKTGVRTEGATYAAFSFTRKVGQGIGMALASLILAFAGYNASLDIQPTEVVSGMSFWFLIFAGGCLLAAGLLMMSYPLTESKFREVLAEIQDKRQRYGSVHAAREAERLAQSGKTAESSSQSSPN